MRVRGGPRRWFGGYAAGAMRRLNDRHPWSHNDAFHAWIETQLPEGRESAVDVGCGRGELLALLAEQFERVHGVDIDDDMRRISSLRCAGDLAGRGRYSACSRRKDSTAAK